MKIKILHYVDADSISWAAAYIEHIKLLRDYGLENVLLCRHGGNLTELAAENNIKFFTFKPLISAIPFLSPSFLKIIKKISPDIIHTRLSSAAGIAGAWRKVLKIPVIATFDKPARAKYYKNLDHYIACAGWLKKYMSEHEGLDKTKIDVIYNPADTERYARDDAKYKKARGLLKISDDDIIFSGMGIYIKRKGFDVLIKAFAKVCGECKNKNLKLMLIGGDGESGMKDSYINIARELGVLEKILMPEKFLSDTREWLWASDIFVMPSREEGFSIALLEGLASGLPVIVSDIEPFTEIIKHNQNGLVAKKDDAESFTAEMLKMLKIGHERREIFAKSALRLVREKFTPRITAEKTIELYKKILNA